MDDKQKLAEKTAELDFLLHYDPLTRLYNRITFEQQLESAINQANQNKYSFTLFFIDLTRFRDINNELGHYMGNQVLCEIAKRIKGFFGEDACCARIDGDEFAVIAPQFTTTNLKSKATELLKLINNRISIQGMSYRLAARVGIANFPDHGNNGLALIKAASIAQDRAQQAGPNNFKVYDQEFGKNYLAQTHLSHELKIALDQNQFFLVYLPRINLQTNEYVAVEALLRWQHPERGLVMPGEIFPAAEQANLVKDIEQWIMFKACEERTKLKVDKDQKIHLGVNITQSELAGPQLVDNLKKALDYTTIGFDYIELELSENIIMKIDNTSQATLEQLSNMGVSIILDDFGTAQSSLTTLATLPIKALKIDRDIISHIITNPSYAMIVKSIITLANNLGINIIAEGVENAQQANFLKEHGCHEAQGFYFCRPIPLDQISDFLNNQDSDDTEE